MTGGGHRALPLAAQQRAVLELICTYYAAAEARGDPPCYRHPTIRYIELRLRLHRKTVQEHLAALYRKGWLRTPEPTGLRCTHVPDTTESR